MIRKILIPALAVLAVAIPTAIFAIDHADTETQVKLGLEERERQLKEEIKTEDDPKAREDLERKTEGIEIFQRLIDIKQEAGAAIKDGNKEKSDELNKEIEELYDRLRELAGDRVVDATIYPEGVDPP